MHYIQSQGDDGAFLPFLPQEAAGLGDEASEEVVQLLNTALAELLGESAEGFWRVLQNDASLAKCLDTYLQFSRLGHCWHEARNECRE